MHENLNWKFSVRITKIPYAILTQFWFVKLVNILLNKAKKLESFADIVQLNAYSLKHEKKYF